MAVQLAVARGVRVIGRASEGSHGVLRAFGAEPVLHGSGLVERVSALPPGGIDAALDAVGSDEAVDASVALVADRKRIVTLAAPQRGFRLGIKVLGGSPGADPGVEIRAGAPVQLVGLAGAGRLHVVVAGTYPLSEAAAAHWALASGHTQGKIVLLP